MKIKNGKDEHEILLLDAQGNVLRKGYIYEFLSSKIFAKDLMNYYINIENETGDDEFNYDQLMLDEIMMRGKQMRTHHTEMDAFIYHCALSTDKAKIEYFKRFPQFNTHEGMHLLKLEVPVKTNYAIDEALYTVRYDYLNTIEEIEAFLNVHSKIFGNAYNVEKIQELQKDHELNCITILKGAEIVGNILTMIEINGNQKIGVIEDMFVVDAYKKQKLGSFLLQEGINHLSGLGVDSMVLEVWSTNERAYGLYEKLGFRFDHETETSIGVYI